MNQNTQHLTSVPAAAPRAAGSNRFEQMTRYVRVRNTTPKRFVEFDFAIGDPSLYVELVLPEAAFEAFCANNHVVIMSDEQAAAVDADMDKWRYGDSRPGAGD